MACKELCDAVAFAMPGLQFPAPLRFNRIADFRHGGRTAMPRFHTIDDLDVAGKRVLLRADLNVPAKDGQVTDDTRIERLAPTIEALIAKGAKIVVMSHFGRPKGPDTENSLRQLVAPLSRAIGGRAVHF